MTVKQISFEVFSVDETRAATVGDEHKGFRLDRFLASALPEIWQESLWRILIN